MVELMVMVKVKEGFLFEADAYMRMRGFERDPYIVPDRKYTYFADGGDNKNPNLRELKERLSKSDSRLIYFEGEFETAAHFDLN